MSLNNCPLLLDESYAVGLFDGALPKTYQGEAKTDRRTGLPLWTVSVSVRIPAVNRRESLQVEIPSSTPASVPFDTTVRLVGLTVTPWSNNERGGVVLRAQALVDGEGNLLFGAVE